MFCDLRYTYFICILHIGFVFVFGRKRHLSFVSVLGGRAENKFSLSAFVSFSAENAKPGFGRSLSFIVICNYGHILYRLRDICRKLRFFSFHNP